MTYACARCKDSGYIFEPDSPALPCHYCEAFMDKQIADEDKERLGLLLDDDIAAFTPRKDGWKPSRGDF